MQITSVYLRFCFRARNQFSVLRVQRLRARCDKCDDTNISIITRGKTLEITITKSQNVFANRAFDMQKELDDVIHNLVKHINRYAE